LQHESEFIGLAPAQDNIIIVKDFRQLVKASAAIKAKNAKMGELNECFMSYYTIDTTYITSIRIANVTTRKLATT